MSRHAAIMLIVLGSASLQPGRPAHASAADAASPAEALFQEGKRLLEGGEARAACPRLAESLRLERATGTLLALARCHELEGRLASARAEYLEVIPRAIREGRADREQAARAWAQALDARVATLTIVVTTAVAQLPGLRIERDGMAVDQAAWGTAIPVDPGPHVITATAPARAPWKATVAVSAAAPGERQTVTIASLSPVEPPEPHFLPQPSLSMGVDRGAVAPPFRSDARASVALLGGVAGTGMTAALGLELAAMHPAGWGAAVRGVWLTGQRAQSIDDEGQVTLRSYALRASGLRRLAPSPRISALVGPEVLLQLDRADQSGLPGGRATWRAGWGAGIAGEINWAVAESFALSVAASVDYGPPSWGGTLEVTNRGEVLRPNDVRLLVAVGPRWSFDPW